MSTHALSRSREPNRSANACGEAWEATLRRWSSEPAIIQASDGQTFTFRELHARSTDWLDSQPTGTLKELRGRAVVFGAPNGIAWFELFLGLLRAGAVAVPVDAAEPAAAQRALAEAQRAAYWWDGSKLLPLARPRRVRDPEICLIKLTSGTTGRPRALAFTAAQLLADSKHVTRTMAITRSDLNYALIPFGHSYGLGNLTLPLLANGVPLVCGAAPLPSVIGRDFLRWRPTVFPGVPPIWRALASGEVDPGNFISLRLAISAGAPLDPGIARAFAARLGRPLRNFYGSSETGGIAFDRTGKATLEGGVGRALRGVSVTKAKGNRIRVCSAAVFTRSNRLRDGNVGCWIPPDEVEVGPRGELRLAGRRGKTVKIAGRRVNLAEVESRLRKIAGVHEAWVGVSLDGRGTLGAAVASERSADELRADLLGDTAPWKVPKKWLILPSLPQTARGKRDSRSLCAQLFGSRSVSPL